jgi:hypothetical protein
MLDLNDHELSVRTLAVGGPVSTTVQIGPGFDPFVKTRIVLLIHGYNNSLSDARGSYSLFLRNACSSAEWSRFKAFSRDIFRFYWPGDKAWGWLRFASYPSELGPAKSSAKLLADFLSRFQSPLELYVIAHSLGNRLLLEMLLLLIDQPWPAQIQLKGICMMAAAVPVARVEWSGNLHYASIHGRSYILYSPGDNVLHWAFPLGESLGGDGVLPLAVGRFGDPQSQWSYKQPMVAGNEQYGHSDYWPKPETIEPITDFLDPSKQRSLPVATPRSRTLATANKLPRNDLARNFLTLF